jgi:trans-aconitate 2-methyltransferase
MQPALDLLQMVDSTLPLRNGLDLGCGTGEISRLVKERLNLDNFRAIDSSPQMLKEAEAFQSPGLSFQLASIENFTLDESIDLLFSNAALHWVADHEKLFPLLLSYVNPKGQVAIQMPSNHLHPSHRLAEEVAKKLFPDKFSGLGVTRNTLTLERYSEILHQCGFLRQKCLQQIYGSPMDSGRDVLEWTKGSLLNGYKDRLTDEEFELFLNDYSKELLSEIGEGSYFCTFRRTLIWGAKFRRG